MIPQIIVKNVDPPSNIWTKKQPKLFEDFLSKVNHLKNEVKEMEMKLKSKDDSYKELEQQIFATLGISGIVKNTNILDFLDSFNDNSQNCELKLLESKVQSLEKEILETKKKKISKNTDIEEIEKKLQDFSKKKRGI